GSEDAIVLALLGSEDDSLVIEKAGVSQSDLDTLRKSISETRGDLIVMFGDRLSDEGQCLLGQLPYSLSATDRRVLLHLLPLFNNSVGLHDMGWDQGAISLQEMLAAAGAEIRSMYIAGSLLPQQLETNPDALEKLDFLVVQELFETATSSHADV